MVWRPYCRTDLAEGRTHAEYSENSMEDYVKDIGERSVLVIASKATNLDTIRDMGGTSSSSEKDAWRIEYDNEDQLASILQRLRDVGMAFLGGTAGWPPAGVADLLRDKGKMHGVIREVTWAGPGRQIVR